MDKRIIVHYPETWKNPHDTRAVGLPAVLLVRLLSGGLEGLPAIFLDGLTLILPRTASCAHARRY